MEALSTGQLLQIAGKDYPYPGRAYYRMFGYEQDGKPETAWQVKEEGWAEVYYTRDRNKNLRLRAVFKSFDCLFAEEVGNGYEFDGHGHVYFFLDEAQADQYVAEQRQRLQEEVQSLIKSTIINLKGINETN